MRHNTERILTARVGSLPAPRDLWSLSGVDPERLRQAPRTYGVTFEYHFH